MADEYVLQTKGLTKEFRGFTAVKNVDLKVRRGTIHALIGPNGAGKTTCFNLLTKFLPPTAGTIRYKGRDITAMNAGAGGAAGAGALASRSRRCFPHLTVLENVRVALQRRARRPPSTSGARSACSTALNGRAMELLDDVGLSALRAAAGGASCPTAASARWRSPPPWRSTPR